MCCSLLFLFNLFLFLFVFVEFFGFTFDVTINSFLFFLIFEIDFLFFKNEKFRVFKLFDLFFD